MGWGQHHTNLWSRRFGLKSAKRGNTVLVIGGSQCGGANVDGGFSIPAPYNVIPAGFSYIRNGAAQVAYPTVDGIVPGLAYTIAQSGKTANIVGRFVDSTTASDWISTDLALAITDVSNAGLTSDVCCVVYSIGGQDCLSNHTIELLPDALMTLEGMIINSFPNAGFICFGLMSTDFTSFPKQAEGRAVGIRFFGDRIRARQYLDPIGLSLQSDSVHPTAAGYADAGTRAGNAIVSAGLIK